MEIQLEKIKSNLPSGYEKKIADEVGCSSATVHNIMNNKKNAARSGFRVRVLQVANRMVNETLNLLKATSETAKEIENLSHGNTD